MTRTLCAHLPTNTLHPPPFTDTPGPLYPQAPCTHMTQSTPPLIHTCVGTHTYTHKYTCNPTHTPHRVHSLALNTRFSLATPVDAHTTATHTRTHTCTHHTPHTTHHSNTHLTHIPRTPTHTDTNTHKNTHKNTHTHTPTHTYTHRKNVVLTVQCLIGRHTLHSYTHHSHIHTHTRTPHPHTHAHLPQGLVGADGAGPERDAGGDAGDAAARTADPGARALLLLRLLLLPRQRRHPQLPATQACQGVC